MGKGYAEGPVAEERLAALERGDGNADEPEEIIRRAVYGATADDPSKHFLGWVGEIDPDALFSSGEAWGLTIVRRSEPV